jgi:hypothetical protein
MVIRYRDSKIINVAKQKVRVHESCYTQPLVWEPTADDASNDLEKAESEVIPDISEDDVEFEFINSDKTDDNNERLPTDKNMVQSIKTLRDHRLKPIGTSHSKSTDIEESAIYGNVDDIREGLFVDTVVFSDVDQLTKLIEEDISKGVSMKDSLIKAIRRTSQVKHHGDLAKGKTKGTSKDINHGNIIDSKRQRQKVQKFVRFQQDDEPEAIVTKERSTNKMKKTRVGKGKQVAQVGDLISVPPEIFDGDEPGSYSKANPDRVFGTVKAISAQRPCYCDIGRRCVD